VLPVSSSGVEEDSNSQQEDPEVNPELAVTIGEKEVPDATDLEVVTKVVIKNGNNN
jgi:hypothetical protein